MRSFAELTPSRIRSANQREKRTCVNSNYSNSNKIKNLLLNNLNRI